MDLFYCSCLNCEGKNLNEKQHNAGRYIIKLAAKSVYNIINPEIEVINNKPRFKFSDINFSISHSNEIAAVCFDKKPIGFDIEQIKQRDFQAIAERMNFSLKENTLEEFYKQWTLYEAEYKLQQETKSSYTFKFIDKYIISAVTNEHAEIEKNLKIYKISNNEIISLK